MYTPGYLTFLDNQRSKDGYPEFVTEDGKKYAEKAAADVLRAHKALGRGAPLWAVVEEIFENRVGRPECFKNIALHDAREAVAYRALLAVNAQRVWVTEN